MEILLLVLVLAWGFLVPLALVLQNALLKARLERLERRVDGLGERSAAESEAAPAHQKLTPEAVGGLFERLLAGRLLIWLGGIALVLAGLFLIRYSIEIGLVTPQARMLAAFLFGIVMLAAGEYARARLADDLRIGQALVGAGIAILYAAAYGSYILYGLIGAIAASAAMLMVTGAALLLSFRHGAPAAAMGLIGGFLTPILVGNPDAGALPLLFYIALLDAALFAVAWRRGWAWLAAAALLLSFAWSGYLMSWPPADARAAGVFVVALAVAGALVPAARRIQPLAIGLALLAILVARTDLGAEAWLLYGLLAGAGLVLAASSARVQLAPPLALLLALILLLAKAWLGQDPFLPWAALGITLLFGGAGLALTMRRGGLFWTALAILGLAGPALCLRLARPELLDRSGWGLLLVLLAIGAGASVAALRTRAPRTRPDNRALLVAGAGVATLAAAAVWDLAPGDLVTAGWLLLAIAFIGAGIRLPEKALRLAGLLLLTATILKAFLLDAAALEGLLRILSFVALGLVLIGIGRAYGPVLRAGSKSE